MKPREEGDIPPEFIAADEWAQDFAEVMMEGYGSSDEIIRRDSSLVTDHGMYSLWPNASGGVTVALTGDVRNSYGQGRLPACLMEDAEQQSYEALKGYLGEHPELSVVLAQITDERRRPALYAYAADKLGKSKDDVDHDVAKAVWLLRDELDDEEREELHQCEDAALDGEYDYGIDIAYLAPDDRGNPHDEPVVEITLTFLEPGNRPRDLDRRYVLPSACGAGLADMLVRWAEKTFQDQ